MEGEINLKKSKFKIEIDDLKRRSKRRWLYFCWKNKVDNIDTKFSQMTREQFMKKYPTYITERGMSLYKCWENTDEYLNLYNLLMQEQSIKDLYNIYNVVRDKALKGDDKSVKTFLLLKKELSKKSNAIEKYVISQQDQDNEDNEQNKDELDITE